MAGGRWGRKHYSIVINLIVRVIIRVVSVTFVYLLMLILHSTIFWVKDKHRPSKIRPDS